MARKEIYNQKNTKLIFNGIATSGMGEGSTIQVEFVGGEADISEGTDGGGLNIATVQGIKVSATYRETSSSVDLFDAAIDAQQSSGTTSVVLLQTGANIKYTLFNALVNKPDNLSTGDKKQGSQTYTFVATQYAKL